MRTKRRGNLLTTSSSTVRKYESQIKIIVTVEFYEITHCNTNNFYSIYPKRNNFRLLHIDNIFVESELIFFFANKILSTKSEKHEQFLFASYIVLSLKFTCISFIISI